MSNCVNCETRLSTYIFGTASLSLTGYLLIATVADEKKVVSWVPSEYCWIVAALFKYNAPPMGEITTGAIIHNPIIIYTTKIIIVFTKYNLYLVKYMYLVNIWYEFKFV